MEPRDAVPQQCALNVPWSMRAPAQTPPPPPPRPKCVNCKGAHPSSSKDCNVWKKEKHIQKVKTERKISYPDARKIVQETSSWLLPGAKPLFALVVAKQMVSCAVQTGFSDFTQVIAVWTAQDTLSILVIFKIICFRWACIWMLINWFLSNFI